MAKQNDSVKVLIGIAVIIILALLVSHSNLKISPFAAITTTTTCVSNVLANYNFDGNVADTENLYNAVNHGASFVQGKFGQAISFNGSNSIDLPTSLSGKDYSAWVKTSENSSSFFFISQINGTIYQNGILNSSFSLPTIGNNFGLGTTLVIDDLTFYSSLPYTQMQNLYANGTGNPACYTTTAQVNVSCTDYATQNLVRTDNTTCLSVSGDYYPNCVFTWQPGGQYYIENNQCYQYYFCPLNSTNNYASQTLCVQNLTYNCYVIQNNQCIAKTDFSSCSTGTHYPDVSSCTPNLNTTSTTQTNSVVSNTQSTSSTASLTKTLFTLPGINLNVNLLELLVLALLAGLGFMLFRNKK